MCTKQCDKYKIQHSFRPMLKFMSIIDIRLQVDFDWGLYIKLAISRHFDKLPE